MAGPSSGNQRAVANQIAKSRQSRRSGSGPKAFWPAPQTGTGYQPPKPIPAAAPQRRRSPINAAVGGGLSRKTGVFRNSGR